MKSTVETVCVVNGRLSDSELFVSPTGQGVKAFVPCAIGQSATDGIRWAMNYVHCMYDTDHQQSGKGVDTSGKDLVRSCFLCHDPGALIRITNGE